MKEYKIGFIILHYMNVEVTQQCIESIIKKVGTKEYKIVVVDNLSPNKSGEVLFDKYREDDRVEVILNKKNDGFARGNNLGYTRLKPECDFICILNNDVELLENNFYQSIERIYKKQRFGILGPQIKMLDGSLCALMPMVGTYQQEKKKYRKKRMRYILAVLGLNTFRERVSGWINKNKPKQKYSKKACSNIVLHGCCLIYSKDFIEKNKYAFDPRTDFYGEEALLFLHTRKQKLQTLYSPEVTILHKESIATKTSKTSYKRAVFQLGNTARSQKILLKELRTRTFVTIFPPIENIHLIKDVGMYPYSMYKYFGYDATVITNKRLEYPYLDSLVKGLMKRNAPTLFSNQEYNCILWLVFHARKIDVLNLFHQVKHTRVSIAIYKRLNRKGKVYVHLDCDGTEYKDYQLGLNGKSIKRRIKRFIYFHIFYPSRIRKDIIWGVQNTLAEKNIVGKFPYDNVKYMPNGYYSEYRKPVSYDKKENTIITVGRIGTKQKRTDLLLDGFVNAYPYFKEPWKLKVIGPIENEFKKEIDEFYKKYPNMRDQVTFTGPIYNRKQLTDEYSRAKVFCLTSDFESFGIVLVEAMAQGCTILASNFAAAGDLINNQENGRVFTIGDVNEFTRKLIEIANDDMYMKHCYRNCQKFVEGKYTYKYISQILEYELKKRKWIEV